MVQFQDKTYEHRPGETVLECLERHGVEVPSFCRNGVCQTCLLKVTAGSPPARAQAGLKEAWKRQGLVLSCVCDPSESLSLDRANVAQTHGAQILKTEYLSPTVLRVLVKPPAGFEFEGGQFVQLKRPSDGVSRPYSIASIPSDDHLEFHIAVYPCGALSGWFAGAVGEEVLVTGPFGECTYIPGEPDRPLLLAGTGTGLAPLVAVLRTALERGHAGPITIYHGARLAEELYFTKQLRQLTAGTQVKVRAVCLQAPDTGSDLEVTTGDLIPLVTSEYPKPQQARIYLCGNPNLVQTLKKRLYIAGADLSRIHSDPFLSAPVTR